MEFVPMLWNGSSDIAKLKAYLREHSEVKYHLPESSIYPSKKIKALKIFNIKSQCLINLPVNNDEVDIDVNQLDWGGYIVEVSTRQEVLRRIFNKN